MARFRATIRGQRGPASRLGSATSGIAAIINGWDVGVYVEARVGRDGNDEIVVTRTGGSNTRYPGVVLAVVREERPTRADREPVTV